MATEVIIDAMPFDAQEIIDPQTQEVSYDRVSVAADFARWMRTYFSNGILVDSSAALGNQFKITADGLGLTVQPGSAVINGRTGWMTNSASLQVASGGSSDRYDRVVLELNIPDDRQMSVKIVAGTTSLPALVRTEDVYQLCLATVKVAAGSAVAVVTDTRADESVCGISKIKYVSNTAGNIGISETTRTAYGLSAADANADKALQKAIDGSLLVKDFNGHKGSVDYLGDRIKSYITVRENRIYSDVTQSGNFLNLPIQIALGDPDAKRIRLFIAPYSSGTAFIGLFPNGLGGGTTLDNGYSGAIIDLYKYSNGDVVADVVAPFYDENVENTKLPVLWKSYKYKAKDVQEPSYSNKRMLVAVSRGFDFGCRALSPVADDIRLRKTTTMNGYVSFNFEDWTNEGTLELELEFYSNTSMVAYTAYTITACVMEY